MNKQMKKEICSLVENVKNVYVSSVDENGYPNTKAMFSMQRDGMGVHYFSSNLSSKRAAQFKQNPKACIYYCDKNKIVLKNHATLRQRFINDSCYLTLKIIVDNDLLEYEKLGKNLSDKEFLQILNKHGIQPPFMKIGEMVTIRRQIELPTALLCLDENHYNNSVDYEIEYELTSEIDTFDLFIDILEKADIIYQPNLISKYQRATLINR